MAARFAAVLVAPFPAPFVAFADFAGLVPVEEVVDRVRRRGFEGPAARRSASSSAARSDVSSSTASPERSDALTSPSVT